MTKILLLIVSLISVLAFVLAIYFLFKNTSQFKNRKKSLIIIISLILIAISFFILAVAVNYVDEVFNQPNDFKDFTNIGAYGDFFGGILNPILAFIGIIAASLAFYAQYEANRQVQIQFEEQKKKDYIQNFENTFYNLINIQNQIISDIDLKPKKIFHFNSELKDFIGNNKIVNESYSENLKLDENSEITSRDVFVYIFDLLDYLLLIDSRIFIDSDIEFIERNIEDVNKFNKVFLTEFDITYNKYKIESKFPPIYNKIYSAVSSDLGHYFRNFYRIIKFIDIANFSENKVDDYKVKYNYTSILRAQISDAELKVLFFNCIYFHGKEKFKPLLEKYSFFKIINTKKIKNNIFISYYRFYDKTAFNPMKTDEQIKNFLDNKVTYDLVIKKNEKKDNATETS